MPIRAVRGARSRRRSASRSAAGSTSSTTGTATRRRKTPGRSSAALPAGAKVWQASAMKTKFMLLSLLLVGAIAGPAMPVPLPGVPGSWVTERPYAPRTIYGYISSERTLALDAADNPHVAYGGDRLYYAHRDAGGWHTEVADVRPGVAN